MILPVGAASFTEAMQMGSEVYHNLKGIIKKKYGQARRPRPAQPARPPCRVHSGAGAVRTWLGQAARACWPALPRASRVLRRALGGRQGKVRVSCGPCASARPAPRPARRPPETLTGRARAGQDATNVGDEGGFAPSINSTTEGLDLIVAAIAVRLRPRAVLAHADA
jgi:hypothetical protein